MTYNATGVQKPGMMMSDDGALICLCYVSTARTDMSPEDIAALMAASKSRNAARDITGLLCLSGRSIMQFLEGHPRQVLPLYQAISQDERHGGCLVLYQSPIAERAFAGWSMALSNVDALPAPQRALFDDIGRLALLLPGSDDSYRKRLDTLLQSFIRCMAEFAA